MFTPTGSAIDYFQASFGCFGELAAFSLVQWAVACRVVAVRLAAARAKGPLR
jgi:hypothetical protein